MMAWRSSGLAAGLMVGIVLAAIDLNISLLWGWLFVVVGTAGIVVSVISERDWKAWPPLAVAVVAFCFALPPGYWRTLDVVGPPQEGSLRYLLAPIDPGTRVQVRGVVAAEPEVRGTGQLDMEVRVQEIRQAGSETWQPVRSGRALLRVYTRAQNPDEVHARFSRLATPAAYGWQVEWEAEYRPIDPPLNPGAFDYGRFLLQSGLDTRFRAHASAVEVREESRGNGFVEVALAAKTSFLDTFRQTVHSPASRLTAAATLGARRSVERIDYHGHDMANMLRHAGVGHVLAVSGLHVSVISVMLFALFRMTGAKPKSFVPVLIVFLILFALLTGARPSSVRAVIMNSVILIAIAYLRCNIRTATAVGLSLSAFFILLRNPTVLFAPSFLLSYGAVLSLIVIAPPLDRLICMPRGFSLGFAVLWLVGVLRLAGWHLPWLIQPAHLGAVLGVLWLLMLAGTRLNHRYPRAWSYNLERIPAIIRMFVAAQLAIQFGMMIPLSAWFFGQFPVAGILVNLFAIPAVGVLVQLGMLTGLVGLIPVVGSWLAIPFGAATALTGDIFIGLAYIGASVFPFPTTPQPSGTWMAVYYALLLALLLLEARRTRLWGFWYRLVPPGPAGTSRKFVAVIPVLLLLWPLVLRPMDPPPVERVQILAEGRYPIITLTGGNAATVINAGTRFSGGRLLSNNLRAQGATHINDLWLPSADPRAGVEGAAVLVERMPIHRVLLPAVPADGEPFTTALGDDYLARQAAAGTSWAVNYDRAFEQLRAIADTHGVALAHIETERVPVWQNARFSLLPLPAETPRRFASSAKTPVLHLHLHGLDWIVVSDTTPDAMYEALADTTSCDVLVVANLSNTPSYGRWLRTAVRRLSPRVVVIAGDTAVEPDQLTEWIGAPSDQIVVQTGEQGAVLVQLRSDHETHFRAYRDASVQFALQPK